jgi:hypothetical protein
LTKTWVKVLPVTVLCAVVALVLDPILWHRAEGMPLPSAGLLPFFIVLSVIEALTFGLGVSFLIFGLPLVRKFAGGSRLLAWATYLGVGWLSVSWWPHDNFHQSVAMGDMQGLLYIEYGFHVTLIAAGLIVTYFFLTSLRRQAYLVEAQPGEKQN